MKKRYKVLNNISCSPVLAVRQQVPDNVAGCVFGGDDVVSHWDAVGSDFCSITVGLVPGEGQTGGGGEGVTFCWGWREVEQVNSGYNIRDCCRGPTRHQITVGARPCLVHCLWTKYKKKKRKMAPWNQKFQFWDFFFILQYLKKMIYPCKGRTTCHSHEITINSKPQLSNQYQKDKIKFRPTFKLN